ncbi:reverse transcriptase, partial [Tanacetum coccineum]
MTGNGRNQNQQQFTRMTKVEFPKFSGDDVKEWIFICEQFFSIDEIPKNQKSGILTVYDDPISEIRKVKYQTNAKEYQDAFDILLSRVDINEEYAVSFYLGGLPAEIEMGGMVWKWGIGQGIPDDEDCFEDYVDELEGNRNSIGIQDLQPQISLNALTGTNNFPTMRVFGTVGKHLVHILVGCGSTHNFLDKNIAKKLGCSIRPTRPLAVTVADGNNLWLATFGDIKCNFKELRMKFKYEGKKVQLRGTHKSNLVWMSDKKSKKNARQVVQGEFHSMTLSVYPTNVISCSNLEGMPMEVDERIKTVLKNYEDVFRIPVELPPQRSHDHRIPLVEGALPVNIRPYRHPPTQKDAIESMVKELLEAGVIKKSHSPFASPIVMVKKKDNSWRMCVDYRQLNKQTVKDKFPIPIIEELIDELHGSKLFTKLDLRSGYHQIRMVEADVAKTAFRTHEGHYEFLVMPFGLTNAPSTFQSLMNETILETMRAHKLFAKLSKCVFGAAQVEYLGHVISAKGVATDPAKIEAMANWHVPTSLKHEQPKQLVKWLSLAKWWYNTNFHTSIHTTPYESVYGKPPPIHIPYIGGESKVDLVDKTLSEREEIVEALK